MTNMLEKKYKNEELGIEITSYIDKQQNAWFKGKDVAEILGYSKTRDVLSRHVDNEDKKQLFTYHTSVHKTGTVAPNTSDYNINMEEQLREYILSGKTDEKQFIIGDQIVTVNPKKSSNQIEKEIKEEYQSVINEENFMRVLLDKLNERSGVTAYFLLLFIKYLINFKNIVVTKGERGEDQIENCLGMVSNIFEHLRKIQRRDILKTDRDLSIINENIIQLGAISREELEDEPMYRIMSYILSDLKDNGFSFDYADRIIDFYNRVKDKEVKIIKFD